MQDRERGKADKVSSVKSENAPHPVYIGDSRKPNTAPPVSPLAASLGSAFKTGVMHWFRKSVMD